MSTAFETLHAQAQQLSLKERAELARRMLATLEPEEEGVEAAWADEIKQRVAAIRDSKVSCISEEQMMGEIDAEIRHA